jgi:hypothetical protein
MTLLVPAGWKTVTVTVSNVVVASMPSGHGFSTSVVTEKVARPFFTRRFVSEPSETVRLACEHPEPAELLLARAMRLRRQLLEAGS